MYVHDIHSYARTHIRKTEKLYAPGIIRCGVIKVVELLANSGDPDQTPRSAASDLGLHCLSDTRLGSPVFNGLRELWCLNTLEPLPKTVHYMMVRI